jgi:enoyl-CoA hydratase/carnithine racemase
MKIALDTGSAVLSAGWHSTSRLAATRSQLDKWQAIPVILERFEHDPAVRVVVLRSAWEQAFVFGARPSRSSRRFVLQKTAMHYE